MEFRELKFNDTVFPVPARYQDVEYIGSGTFGQVIGAIDTAPYVPRVGDDELGRRLMIDNYLLSVASVFSNYSKDNGHQIYVSFYWIL